MKLAHEAYEDYLKEPILAGLGIHKASFCAGHDAAVQEMTEAATDAALVPAPGNDGGSDYVLKREGCWIEVGAITVYIFNKGEGVAVALTPTWQEFTDLGSAYADFPKP